MPGIINSAPDCVTHAAGSEKARVDDSADFILQNDYSDCAGFMTFEQRHALGGTLGEGLPQLLLLHEACFSLHVIQTRVQGIAFSRAAAISSPQSRQTP